MKREEAPPLYQAEPGGERRGQMATQAQIAAIDGHGTFAEILAEKKLGDAVQSNPRRKANVGEMGIEGLASVKLSTNLHSDPSSAPQT